MDNAFIKYNVSEKKNVTRFLSLGRKYLHISDYLFTHSLTFHIPATPATWSLSPGLFDLFLAMDQKLIIFI